jgi:hypothetical protein
MIRDPVKNPNAMNIISPLLMETVWNVHLEKFQMKREKLVLISSVVKEK